VNDHYTGATNKELGMKNRYNLALSPTTQNPIITGIAQQFSQYADRYLLGNNALAHVTLCHFEAETTELQTIWERAYEAIRPSIMPLRFIKISRHPAHGFFWVSLVPDHTEELWEFHRQALQILKINEKVWFDPHMTLFNSVDEQQEAAVSAFEKSFTGLEDNFILTLGTSGFAGQFKKILFQAKS
jgi:hypothetical protein